MTTIEEIEAQARSRREHPIYGTDFSKPVSVLIEDCRNQIVHTRGQLSDIIDGCPGYAERLEHVRGLLTCGLVALYQSCQEIIKIEIARDDALRGPSIGFCSRGVGLDVVPGCFVCGATKRDPAAVNGYLHNIAAFVNSPAAGRMLESWFSGRARTDFRDAEPHRIQLKVGACERHLPRLNRLHEKTRVHNVIRKLDIEELVNEPEESHA